MPPQLVHQAGFWTGLCSCIGASATSGHGDPDMVLDEAGAPGGCSLQRGSKSNPSCHRLPSIWYGASGVIPMLQDMGKTAGTPQHDIQ
ncbi:MAG: hypothetical protein FRX49_09176 [Trebouxia sp. A1-2]|nr:MAG: hypothetical protein FRX49_09176 [Trebouxia sp. A1-2]